MRVWDIQSGKQLHIIEGFASPLHFLTVSPDGARALIRDEYSMAVSVSLAPTDALTHLRGHSGTVNAVAFSPDGARLVTGAGNWNAEDDARAMVWDVKTGRLVRTLTGHASSVNCVAYYPDGKRVATGSRDQSAIVWDVDSARPLLTLAGHGGQVRSLALSRDGKRLVTGSWDHTAMLWDAETGERLAVLEGCEDVLDSVAFAPSGREVLTGSRDGKVRYWDVDTARVTKTLSLGLGMGVVPRIFARRRVSGGGRIRQFRRAHRDDLRCDERRGAYGAARSRESCRIVGMGARWAAHRDGWY